MSNFLIFLMLFLFVATPLAALLSFHADCQYQVCHMLMTNLFILISTAIVSTIFLTTQLINKVPLFGTLYQEEIFLPPRF